MAHPGPLPTLHSALGSSGTHGTEGANHEVREELVLVLALAGDVCSKVGDLGALGLALEGAGVGRGHRASGRSHGGGADGSDGDGGGSWPDRRAQAETGSGRESRHREGRGVALAGGSSKGRVEVFSLVVSADDALPKVLGEKCGLRLLISSELGNWRIVIGPVDFGWDLRSLPDIWVHSPARHRGNCDSPISNSNS